jgi:hypothetical protein
MRLGLCLSASLPRVPRVPLLTGWALVQSPPRDVIEIGFKPLSGLFLRVARRSKNKASKTRRDEPLRAVGQCHGYHHDLNCDLWFCGSKRLRLA